MVVIHTLRSSIYHLIIILFLINNAYSFYHMQRYREYLSCANSLTLSTPCLSTSNTILRATRSRRFPTNSSIDYPSKTRLPYADVVVADSKKSIVKPYRPDFDEDIPHPLRNIVDVDVQKRCIIYEVEFNQQAITSGNELDLVMVANRLTIGKVKSGSKLEALGVRPGDVIVSTSATAGDQMWSHDSVQSIRSALATRFVLYPSVKFRMERSLDDIDPSIRSRLMVPYIKIVHVRRPIGN